MILEVPTQDRPPHTAGRFAAMATSPLADPPDQDQMWRGASPSKLPTLGLGQRLSRDMFRRGTRYRAPIVGSAVLGRQKAFSGTGTARKLPGGDIFLDLLCQLRA
jgi:hypothetical protein